MGGPWCDKAYWRKSSRIWNVRKPNYARSLRKHSSHWERHETSQKTFAKKKKKIRSWYYSMTTPSHFKPLEQRQVTRNREERLHDKSMKRSFSRVLICIASFHAYFFFFISQSKWSEHCGATVNFRCYVKVILTNHTFSYLEYKILTTCEKNPNTLRTDSKRNDARPAVGSI